MDGGQLGELVIDITDYVEHPKFRLMYLYGLAILAVLSMKWLVSCLIEFHNSYWARMYAEHKMILILHTIFQVIIYINITMIFNKYVASLFALTFMMGFNEKDAQKFQKIKTEDVVFITCLSGLLLLAYTKLWVASRNWLIERLFARTEAELDVNAPL